MASWSGRRSSTFREMFEKPLPENPTLMESLANPWMPRKPVHEHVTEIFGELHFRDPSYDDDDSSSSLYPRPSGAPPTSKDVNQQPEMKKLDDDDDDKSNENNTKPSSDSLFGIPKNQYMKSTDVSSKKAESLQLCTEGLGFESSGDAEDTKAETGEKGKMSITSNNSSSSSENLDKSRRLKSLPVCYPPPLTCLSRHGKTWICLKSFKFDGRFVLKEVEIPNREILRACRKDGRLTLHFVNHEEDIITNLDESDYDDDAYEQEEDKGDGKKSELGNVLVEDNP